MAIALYTIITISCLSNMAADLFLSSGLNYTTPKQTVRERVRNTPEKNLLISAVLGLISIAFWQLPLLLLQDLSGVLGNIAKVSFAMYIGTIMTFHVVCSASIHFYKLNEETEAVAMRYISIFGFACVVPSLIYTVAMIYMGVSGSLNMQWFHYLGLPFFSMIIIQFTLGKLLEKIPYYSTISGTLSMMVSLLLTVHLMVSNGVS